MPARRPLATAVALAVLALTACSDGERAPGEPVTEDDAQILAELLHRNHEEGGADFVVSVPFGDDALLTLTGEVDFRTGAGRAQAVTVVDDEERDARTLFFDRDELWAGDVPGLPEALAADGAPDAAYLRRPLPADPQDPELLDVLVQMLLNLAQPEADDPELFLDGPYRWQAQEPIDGRATVVYRLRDGRSVAVDAADRTLVQYRATLPDSGLDVTLTLADHGTRRVTLPEDGEAAAAADHPQVAADFGV
ncbi:hypothetical protein DQ237_04275 [Blastococcus sp. TF02-8]|uniref:hypothetical protein n=1 Tax=Blastococcus sp. TF02-8 TaxID=2250574 RepID=UPI000DEABC90|nr:hypothetical protein [Blastococcus sp. TF02-8]RBY96844.1 hypothetical protein DQ237_04275 [Blastococcus sp. TF02-8]